MNVLTVEQCTSIVMCVSTCTCVGACMYARMCVRMCACVMRNRRIIEDDRYISQSIFEEVLCQVLRTELSAVIFLLLFFFIFINFRPFCFIAWDTVAAWYKLPLVVVLVVRVQLVLVVPYLPVQVAMYPLLVQASACYSYIGPAADHNIGHSTELAEEIGPAFVDNPADTNSSFAGHIRMHIDLLLP
jgi:hypothetical protein